MKKLSGFLFLIFGLLLTLSVFALPVSASHSWGNYHWGRTVNPFTLKLGDNVSLSWDTYLQTTSNDWSQSTVLDTNVIPRGINPRNCRPTSGQVEVCNYRYGNNGWLGLAQIWISGSHITQGVTKVNDTYFNTAKYNTPAWKNLVMCQEVGHIFGLDHQDEVFNNANLGSCMDYTNDPTSNQHPNSHDFDQLITIYSHFDTVTTVNQTKASIASGNFDNRKDWGREIKNNGKVAVYERDFGGGQKLFTFIIWAQE